MSDKLGDKFRERMRSIAAIAAIDDDPSTEAQPEDARSIGTGFKKMIDARKVPRKPGELEPRGTTRTTDRMIGTRG